MIIDTHTHCYWETLESRIGEIVEHMQYADIRGAIQIGCDIETSKKAINLAKRFPGIFYATVGHHPETAQDVIFSEERLKEFETLIHEHRDLIVGVGECGLDFHYLDGSEGGTKPINIQSLSEKAEEQIRNQKDWWIAQWQLAQKYNLPLIVHTRDARDATLEFMRQHHINRAVMHCYSEDPEFAQSLMDISDDIYFSFSGILTYKSAKPIQETARILPLSRILVETDAPFLAPQAVRGQINEPAYTAHTLEYLATLRGDDRDEVEKIVFENSLRCFSLPL